MCALDRTYFNYLRIVRCPSEPGRTTLQLQDLIIQHCSQEVLELGFLTSDLFCEILGRHLKLVPFWSLGSQLLGSFAKPTKLNIPSNLCAFVGLHIVSRILVQSRSLTKSIFTAR